jgi:hypothetical protein
MATGREILSKSRFGRICNLSWLNSKTPLDKVLFIAKMDVA